MIDERRPRRICVHEKEIFRWRQSLVTYPSLNTCTDPCSAAGEDYARSIWSGPGVHCNQFILCNRTALNPPPGCLGSVSDDSVFLFRGLLSPALKCVSKDALSAHAAAALHLAHASRARFRGGSRGSQPLWRTRAVIVCRRPSLRSGSSGERSKVSGGTLNCWMPARGRQSVGQTPPE